MKSASKSGLFALVATAFPAAAYAHPAAGEAAGFVHGFTHPISGIDHVLAMIMVGVFAYQLGGRATWLVPTTFLLVMAVGGAVGVVGIDIPFVEAGIALSVALLGAIVAFNVKAPAAIAMAVVGLFATFHGHAHGTEMPEHAAGAAYGGGFLIATALLHAVGLGLGCGIGRIGERRGFIVTRLAGGFAAAAGLGILAGMI
ncbi:urease accessory protein [Rhizobium azibense]|uniref:Urease accessory protein n=1 Tax=Rhizobium azibense TaxID=1136135 RepID=A0A4R3R5E0_9HYPH|nr:HupE/UreJ family protein [Rhizobium azibense]TCU29157.1 urease accessory protein [Rhizobium azibense]